MKMGIFEAKSALLRGEGHRLRWLRCAGLRSATAALGSNGDGESGVRGLQKDIGNSARSLSGIREHKLDLAVEGHSSVPKIRSGPIYIEKQSPESRLWN
jgi:hypothetical protein